MPALHSTGTLLSLIRRGKIDNNKLETFGYDRYLRRLTAFKSDVVTAVDFDSQYEVKTKSSRMSAMLNDNFVVFSNIGTASGSVGAGTRVFATTTLHPGPNVPLADSYRNFGLPLTALYEGTSAVGSMQIFPNQGNGIASDKFRMFAGFDYALSTGSTVVYKIMIHNTAGTTADLYFLSQWKYTDHGVPNP